MARERLPVIVGFGGINTAGRSSLHHAYARMVYDALAPQHQQQTLASLGALMGVESPRDASDYILAHTLVRRIESSHFDVNAVAWNQRFPARSNGLPVSFDIERKHLPKILPASWTVSERSVTHAHVEISGEQEFLLPILPLHQID